MLWVLYMKSSTLLLLIGNVFHTESLIFLMLLTYNLFFRGLLLQKQGRYEEAIQCYENAIKYRPRLAGKSKSWVLAAVAWE